MIQKLKKNIKLSYIFRSIYTFSLTDGIWVLFLLQKGLPLWQVGIMESIYHAASLIAEVPSGALADLLGRKKVLMLSRVLAFVSSIPLILSNNFFILAINFVFTAWGSSLISGTEEALVYDSFLGMGEEKRYFNTVGRLGFMAEVSQAAAVFVGGFIAKHSYILCFLIGMAIDVVAFAVCCFLTEPRMSGHCERVTIGKHFRLSFDVIRGDRHVRYLLLHYAVLSAFFVSVYFYSQEFYFSRGFDEVGISLILLSVGASSSVGALLSERIAGRLGRYTEYLGGAAIAAGLMLMSVGDPWLSLAGYAAASFASAMLEPYKSAQLNSRIPSEQRATIISVSSMCFSVVMIVLFPVIGAFSDSFGLERIILALGGVLLLYNHIASMIRRRQ